MNYADIKTADVANGPGIRISLFVSGCRHGCKGCFNREAWDFQYGSVFTNETIEEILQYLAPSYIAGLTLLGGEPLEKENQESLAILLKKVKEKYPQKNIWCYTGFDYEQDVLGYMYGEWPHTKNLLAYVDVLVDGKFVEEKKDLNLRFRGSSNQRIILLQESLKAEKVILWEPKES